MGATAMLFFTSARTVGTQTRPTRKATTTNPAKIPLIIAFLEFFIQNPPSGVKTPIFLILLQSIIRQGRDDKEKPVACQAEILVIWQISLTIHQFIS
jgi:hypothetical protein